jgi:hypothetical protein
MEIWKDIKGYEGLYQVSNMGRVKSMKWNKERILKVITNRKGYSQVHLSKNGLQIKLLIHRLVAEAFILNPHNLPNVLHGDDNPANNCVENLRWGTQKENIEDRNNKGRQAKGLSHGSAILTEQQVLEIKNLRSSTGWGYRRISKHLKFPLQAVSGILYKNTWSHI